MRAGRTVAGGEPAGEGTVPVKSVGLFLVTVGGPSGGNGADVIKSRFSEDYSGSSLNGVGSQLGHRRWVSVRTAAVVLG